MPLLGWHIVIWLVVGAVVATGTAVLLWWGLGNPAMTGPNAPKPQDKFDIIKIALTVTGGIGGVIFLVIGYRKQRLGEAAERRENTKEKREDTKLFNERQPHVEPYIEDSMCAVFRAVRDRPPAKSLAAIHPKDVSNILINPYPGWTREEQAKINAYSLQPALDGTTRKALPAPRFKGWYSYAATTGAVKGMNKASSTGSSRRFSTGSIPVTMAS